MPNKVQVVIQQALRTFTRNIKIVPEGSQTELNELKSLADDLTTKDITTLGELLNAKHMREFLRKDKTHVDYVSVHEDDFISVGVFILGQGAKLPIHDHPNMYGIIKVLEGILKVTSYSVVELDTSIATNDRLYYNNPLKVIKYPGVLLANKDKSCLLTPTDKNIHEVECVEGPAAFLDILSPPYGNGAASEPRSCHYFQEVAIEVDAVNNSEDNYLRLIQIPNPF